ncbi:DUF6660 family protein [Telluribacter humicola]|uniref:DUF6660 family protein n=1 Tax=Telluribacter humicola TaxID=1720261 RepID=UPI0035B593E0
MKQLSVLSALFLLLLSCFPCTDSQAASAVRDTLRVELSHDHQNHGQEADLCPPFCQCNCCGGFALFFQLATSIPPRLRPINTVSDIYVRTSAVSPSFAFWHPPRL